MEVEALARYMRIPPRKARLVAATVVGLPVKEALVILDFTPRAAAKEIAKVVKSAAANATNNFNQDEDTLFVKSIVVNEGPTLKRGRARARGMYFSIFKRTSHITATVDTREVAATTRRRRAAAAGAPTTAPGTRAKAAAPRVEKAGKAKAEKGTDKSIDNAKAAAAEAARLEEVSAVAEEARAVEAEEETPPVVTTEEVQQAAVAEDVTAEKKEASAEADAESETGSKEKA
jgi:large subunit ribosomal protein L22